MPGKGISWGCGDPHSSRGRDEASTKPSEGSGWRLVTRCLALRRVEPTPTWRLFPYGSQGSAAFMLIYLSLSWCKESPRGWKSSHFHAASGLENSRASSPDYEWGKDSASSLRLASEHRKRAAQHCMARPMPPALWMLCPHPMPPWNDCSSINKEIRVMTSLWLLRSHSKHDVDTGLTLP